MNVIDFLSDRPEAWLLVLDEQRPASKPVADAVDRIRDKVKTPVLVVLRPSELPQVLWVSVTPCFRRYVDGRCTKTLVGASEILGIL